MHLKNHANKKDDEMKKVGTKLKTVANDQDHLVQLVMGRGQVRLADQKLNVMVEDLQQRLQALERRNEELKPREHAARQRRRLRNGRNSVYSGQQKLQNNVPACYPNPPNNVRRLRGGKAAAGLLEEARAEIAVLKRKNMLQQSHIKVLEGALERLQEQLRKKEAEHEKKLLQVHQQEASKIWSSVETNVTLTSLQKQITDKSNAVAELEDRFLQVQRSHGTLKANYHAAVAQMNDLLAQLNKEKEKSLQLEKQLQVPVTDNDRVHGLHQQLAQVKEERDVLRERVSKLHQHTCDACQAQKSQLQEQRLQISQLQTALKAQLVDKKALLSKFRSEQETNQELTAEVGRLKEKQRRLAEPSSCLNSAGEFNQALLPVKQREGRKETEPQAGGAAEGEGRANATQELQDAYAKTMQELQNCKKVLSAERESCRDFKLKLEDMTRKMNEDQARAKQKRQAKLLDLRAEHISSLEAQRRQSDAAACARPEFLRGRGTNEERLEGLIDLQIVGVRLSSAALKLLGEDEPATFCTYVFFRFDIHSTPVVRGQQPKYAFTSKYVVKMEEDFLDYASSCSVLVELHQRLVGCDWRTVATAHLPLRQILEPDGKVQGSVPLVSVTNEALAFGSLDYCIRLKLPVAEEPSGRSPAASAWVRSWAQIR